MTPPETAAIEPEAKKVNVAAKPDQAAAAQTRVGEKRAPPGLVSIRLSAPGASRPASTNGFVTGWSTGATAVGGAAGRSFLATLDPLSQRRGHGALSSNLSQRMAGSTGARRPSDNGTRPERTPVKLIADWGVRSRCLNQLLKRDCPHCGATRPTIELGGAPVRWASRHQACACFAVRPG